MFEGQGQGVGSGNHGHLHNDVTVQGSTNDVIGKQDSTASSDAVTNSNGLYCVYFSLSFSLSLCLSASLSLV